MNDSALYLRFGALVRRHRQRLGASQADIAVAIGLSRASVANIETGRQHIPIHHLYRLARALEVDVHALLPKNADGKTPTVNREIQSSLELSESEHKEVAQVLGLINDGSRVRQ